MDARLRSSVCPTLLTRFRDRNSPWEDISLPVCPGERLSPSLSFSLSRPRRVLVLLIPFRSRCPSRVLRPSPPGPGRMGPGGMARGERTPSRRQHKDLRLRDAPINMLRPCRSQLALLRCTLVRRCVPFLLRFRSALFCSTRRSVRSSPHICTLLYAYARIQSILSLAARFNVSFLFFWSLNSAARILRVDFKIVLKCPIKSRRINRSD